MNQKFSALWRQMSEHQRREVMDSLLASAMVVAREKLGEKASERKVRKIAKRIANVSYRMAINDIGLGVTPQEGDA